MLYELPKAKKGRPRGFIDWHPRNETEALILQVKGILEEYREYLPMTIRQIFYRLVGAHNYEKDEKAYKRLCEIINKSRRARLIPFWQIRDDGFSELQDSYFDSPQSFIKAVKYTAQNYKLDPQSTQPVRLFVWCEAAGMATQLEQVSRPFGVPVLSSGGFDSLTAKYNLACKFKQYKAVKVFHIGDHDPSGVHIFGSLDEDVREFLKDCDTEIQFERLAVTPEHIKQYNLPTAPPKSTDKRNFVGQSVQAEALPPDILCGILGAALNADIDTEAQTKLLEKQMAERNDLLLWTDNIHFNE